MKTVFTEHQKPD